MILFPDPPRSFPGKRWTKIVVRAVHVLCAGVLTGAHLMDVGDVQQDTAMKAAVVTGLIFLALDLYESAAFLLQVRGLVVLLKLALLLAVPWLPDQGQGWVLAGIVVLAVISSHAPAAVRYHLLFGRGRVADARTKG